ncbi:hypothetical protein BU16DRAFT_519231 [Lophium mytilinum]|uniref:Monopolin complex subunit Csm1/Pcs1 C-terminal domain-containing protein n=1 Tax=Lophium mytilinum TaxID=390894 RepID=A0A6A6QB68_9PEZI|nr:hypothetical protein BU16DRAFT_519231 [Lophium mytilinum]
MPRAMSKIAYMVDSASEDEINGVLLTPDSAIENHAPGRKGKPIAKKPTTTMAAKGVKAKAAPRRVSGASVLGAKKAGVAKKTAAGGKRKVLGERAEMSETEEVEHFEDEEMEEEEAMPAPKKKGRPRKSNESSLMEVPPPKVTGKRAPKAAAAKAAPKAAAKTTKGAKRVVKQEPDVEIPETQPEPDMMDMDDSIEQSVEFDDDVPEMPPPRKPVSKQTAQPKAASKQRQNSVQRQTSVPRRRAGSASDTERGGNDPTLRRKLGDLRNQFENINLKYQNLKEIGMTDKETVFEQLKRTTDQREKDQDAVIRSLKQQVASLQTRSSETSSLRKELAVLTAANTKLTSENKSLSESLATAQNENKTISAKLAQARSSAPPEGKAGQGSAMKQQQRSVVLPGSAEAQKEVQIRKLKEDLYTDLTGLIIRGVKKGDDDEDIFDCIQTGRNGTLHFHFTVPADDDDTEYNNVNLDYLPMLDEKRDADLFDILPEYATDGEGISFPRHDAVKFYSKIVECMTKKIILED